MNDVLAVLICFLVAYLASANTFYVCYNSLYRAKGWSVKRWALFMVLAPVLVPGLLSDLRSIRGDRDILNNVEAIRRVNGQASM